MHEPFEILDRDASPRHFAVSTWEQRTTNLLVRRASRVFDVLSADLAVHVEPYLGQQLLHLFSDDEVARELRPVVRQPGDGTANTSVNQNVEVVEEFVICRNAHAGQDQAFGKATCE